MSAYSIATRGLAGRKVPQGVLATMDDLLFSGSEQGAWYDPSDMSTLFQDSAGTVPVTAVEQPVGRILDKSGRGNHATQVTTTKRPVLSRRVNLLTNTEFAGASSGTPGVAPTGWGFPFASGETVVGAGLRMKANAGRIFLEQNYSPSPIVQSFYFSCEVDVNIGTNLSGFVHVAGTSAASVTYYLDGSITAPATPVAIGRHKLAVLVVTNGSAAPLGARVGVGTTGTNTGDITVLNSSLVSLTDAHLPYQYVNTASDYDADPAKFPAYLRFDGVDDALQTGNIDFTGTDKMTVWAGVTKLSDAVAVIFELSDNWNFNSGGFLLSNNAGSFTYHSASRGVGGVGAGQVAQSIAGEVNTSVLAITHDIPGDLSTIRRNGIPGVDGIGEKGAGSFGNYPLYIGARTGTSIFFNGRLYGLIVRGAQSTLSQIEATEAYIKQKMRLS